MDVFVRFEQVKHIFLTMEQFTVENGALTPTLKLRRCVLPLSFPLSYLILLRLQERRIQLVQGTDQWFVRQARGIVDKVVRRIVISWCYLLDDFIPWST